MEFDQMFALIRNVLLVLLTTSPVLAFYPLHPSGNQSALLGNTGLALYDSDSALAYNPASIAGLKFNNFSVGTSFIGITQIGGNIKGSFADRSESPNFELSSGFLGTYFSMDQHKFGLFAFKKYSFKMNKYFVLTNPGTEGDFNAKLAMESDRIGGIYATKLTPELSLGVTVHVDAISSNSDSNLKALSSGITQVSYTLTESKVTVLGTRLGVYYEFAPYHHYAFIYEPRGVQISQSQTRSAVTISTAGSVNDTSLRQDTDETTGSLWGLGYRYIHSSRFEYLFDLKLSKGMTFEKSLINSEIPDMNQFGAAMIYNATDIRSYYGGFSTTTIIYANPKDQNVSNTVTYISAGASQQIRYLKTLAGLYYSHYQTTETLNSEPQTNMKSYGMIFSTSYDF